MPPQDTIHNHSIGIDETLATLDSRIQRDHQTSPSSVAGSQVTGPTDSKACCLADDIRILRAEVARCDQQIKTGQASLLPGNVAFLADGRALCRERQSGDSRYPYGQDGFNFWVRASGQMHANHGLFFFFLPQQEGREPSIAFFAGCRPNGETKFAPHSMLPVPWVGESESRILDRYTILGHDAAYFVTETPELITAVRVFLDSSQPNLPRLCLSLYLENRTESPLDSYCSSYWNPFCRHSFVETNEDRWFKKMSLGSITPLETSAAVPLDDHHDAGLALPPFVLNTHEDVGRFKAFCNIGMLNRTARMTNQVTGQHLDLAAIPFEGSGPSGESAVFPREAGKNGAGTPSVGTWHTQECTSRLQFLGAARRGLGSAKHLTTGHLTTGHLANGQPTQESPTTVFNDISVAGDIMRFVLPTDTFARIDYVFSVQESMEPNQKVSCTQVALSEVDTCLDQVRSQHSQLGDLNVSVEGTNPSNENNDADSTFNHFFTYLKKQVEICTTLTGYINPAANSLIGIRDVFQAIEGHLLDQPEESRKKILEALNYVLVDGRCPRQYSLPAQGNPGRMDLREYIDQGVWVVSVIYTYLSVTGDYDLLDQVVGYHQVSEEVANTAVPAEESDTVMEHLLRIVSYLDQQRDPVTRLVLAMYGDWNDAVDGLGIPNDPGEHFGTGVSVMTSLQLYQNCEEMIELIERAKSPKHKDALAKIRQLRKELRAGFIQHAIVQQDGERRLLHGWGDQQSYSVGGFSDCDGLARDGLTSNAFWILSGMLEEDLSLREDILAALERLDSKYGLKTFEPGFGPEARSVGRIVNVPIGSAENGAVYIHATTFAIAALFRIGEPESAWEQIHKILPFAEHFKDPSHSPFVMPNSYLENAALNLDGQSMDDWQTGSSNVLLKLLVRYVFGFHPRADFLCIEPANYFPFESFHFQAKAHQCRIQIDYCRKDVARREVTLNGKPWNLLVLNEMMAVEGAQIPYDLLSAEQLNLLTITDPLEA